MKAYNHTANQYLGAAPLLMMLLLYFAFLVYGVLYPFSNWQAPSQSLITTLLTSGSKPITNADVLQNLLLYLPLGILFFFLLNQRWWLTLVLAFLAALIISVTLECLQAFLPQRVPSVVDIGLNVASAVTGVVLAAIGSKIGLPRLFCYCRDWMMKVDASCFFALGLLAAWALWQWWPLIPSLEHKYLAKGVAPLWQSWQLQQLIWSEFYRNLIIISSFFALSAFVMRATFWGIGSSVACLLILAIKIIMVGNHLTLEVVAAWVVLSAAAIIISIMITISNIILSSDNP